MSDLSEKIKAMREMAYASYDNIQTVLRYLYDMFDENEDNLKDCFEIDKEGTDKKEKLVIKRMLDSIQNVINYEFEDTNVNENIDGRRVLEFKQNQGVIGVFYDGNVYVTVDLICKALKTNNAIILNVGIDNYIGTNNFIIKLVKQALEHAGKPEGLVEINFSENDDMANEDLDQMIVIGEKNKQLKINSLNVNTLHSGYGYNEIYIEDLENEEFIKTILSNTDNNFRIYVKNGVETAIPSIKVNDYLEAIDHINKDGAGYATAIFSNDENAQRNFVKRVKSKYVFVNASPEIAREIDIEIEKLYYKKLGMV